LEDEVVHGGNSFETEDPMAAVMNGFEANVGVLTTQKVTWSERQSDPW